MIRSHRLIAISLVTSLSWASVRAVAIAQIIPDTTLSSENSIVNTVTTGGASTYTITGGATRGNNLFHSFDQFSISVGDTAVFADANSIANIISRVTGGNVSELEGIIRTGGNANLFLINPAGIVIGPNARLEIGGSFLASTGRGLRFENGFLYDTLNPEVPPLLTVTAPIGLAMGETPGDIRVFGQGSSPLSAFSVPDGQTLALIGGNVSLTEARLTAAGGHLEIGSVNEAGELSLSPTSSGFDIGFDSVNRFGNIQISDGSVLDTSGTAGGSIELQGQQVTIAGQSALISDTLGDQDGRGIQINADSFRLLNGSFIGAATSGTGASSSIEITATDEIELIGNSITDFKFLQFIILLGLRQVSDRQRGGLFTTTTGAGQVGDISLSAQRILIDEGDLISTDSLGTGRSGDIKIVAPERFQIRGSGMFANSLVSGIPLVTFSGTATGLSTSGVPAGAGGDITVDTAQLILEEGGSISSSTLSDQPSGNIVINATDSVILRGFFAAFPIPTAITTNSLGGTGAAGDVQISTGRFVLQDGSRVFTDSGALAFEGIIPFGGPSGNLIIDATESIEVIGGATIRGFYATNLASTTYTNEPAGLIQLTTPILQVVDGGRIISATFGSGSGGAVDITSETVIVAGANEQNRINSGIFANSGTNIQSRLISGRIEPLPGTGAGGTVTINTDSLTVQDSAEISVASFGSGAAGNLNVTADNIGLNSSGRLTAATTLDGGGNINLNADILSLDSSRITANSDSGDGGNLAFNLRNLLLLRNGSLISTEAGTAGAGGNGGDIILNLPDGFIVAVPTENSDIRANAFEGNGGNVDITARSLLGIAFRPGVLDTPLSDITASSRFGNSGMVTIDELTPDIIQDDATLPTETAPSALAQGCRAQGAQTGSFVSTGRGGLPASPADLLSDDTVWQDLAPITISATSNQNTVTQAVDTSRLDISNSMVEAQGWMRTDDGTVILVAQQKVTPDISVLSGCEID